jgi:hypothetical protein
MKKLGFILFAALFMILAIGCSPPAEPYDSMTQLEPVQITANFGLFDSEKLWVTHELRLNDNEMLLYAPKNVKIGDNYYINDSEVYFIRSGTEGDYRYERIDVEDVTELLRE